MDENILEETEVINYDVMRYDLDEQGYIYQPYFGCSSGTCTEYTGTIPEGYDSLEEWYEDNFETIRAWKIVDGNLVFDANKYNELQEQCEIQEEENSFATRKWVRNQLGKSSSVVVDEFSNEATGTSLIVLEDSGAYEIPKLTINSGVAARSEIEEIVNVVVSNKNVLGIDAVSSTKNGIETTINSDGSIKLNGTLQARLPSEYQEVEYIESTRLQKIDTGVNSDNKLRTIFDISFLKNYIGAIGAISSSLKRYHFVLQNNISFAVNYKTYTLKGTTTGMDTNRHIIDVNPIDGYIKIDNESITIPTTSFDTGVTFGLFYRNSNNESYKELNESRLYGCKMYYDNVLIRNFIPCYRKSDNEIGLYDLVNDVFYNNSGTGTFLKGNDVNIPIETEIDLKGTSENTDMLFLIKENLNYVVSGLVDGTYIDLYNYDGTDRTLVSSSNNGSINLSTSYKITQSVLRIDVGTTFDNVIIYPQIEIGEESTDYIKHQENKATTTITDGTAEIDTLYSYSGTTVLMADLDVELNVDYFKYKSLDEKFAEIVVTEESIKSQVSETITNVNDLQEKIGTIQSTILEQTNEAFTMWFEQTGLQSTLDTVQNELNNNTTDNNTLKEYIHFEGAEITLGKSDSQTKLVIKNDRISFMTGETESAYISENTLYITDSTILNKLQIGHWETVEDEYGNLNDKWVGGE